MGKLFMSYFIPEDVTEEFEGKLSRGKIDMVGIEVTLMDVNRQDATETADLMSELMKRLDGDRGIIRSVRHELDLPNGYSLIIKFMVPKRKAPRGKKELLKLLLQWETNLFDEGKLKNRWAYASLILKVRKPSKRMKCETLGAEIYLTQERPELNLFDYPCCGTVANDDQTSTHEVWERMSKEEQEFHEKAWSVTGK